MIVSLLNQKCGVGKTTLAINLADAFASCKHRVLLIDADPQGSALAWSAVRTAEPAFPVVGMPKASLRKDLPGLAAGYDVVLVDGPPRSNEIARSAILAADFVLIPAQPSPVDIWATDDTVRLVVEAQTYRERLRAAFVINRRIPNTAIGRDVRAAFADQPFAPNSQFSPHVHSGGEEFLVIDGVFQDEHGDFPVGSYIRNPPTTSHTPGSAPGCVIFVKLWQFDPDDRTQVCIDTSKRAFTPTPERARVEVMPLFKDQIEDVRLERWAPGANVELTLTAGGEFLVLDGDFNDDGETFAKHAWLRLPPGGHLKAVSGTKGCTVWVKSGHLTSRISAPKTA